jgi:hypothetical protein
MLGEFVQVREQLVPVIQATHPPLSEVQVAQFGAEQDTQVPEVVLGNYPEAQFDTQEVEFT